MDPNADGRPIKGVSGAKEERGREGKEGERGEGRADEERREGGREKCFRWHLNVSWKVKLGIYSFYFINSVYVVGWF